MNHKGRIVAIALLLGSVAPTPARAERRSVLITEASSSGRLVRVNLGASSGLAYNDPVLFSEADRKLAAGRVIRLAENSAIVAVLEKYGSQGPGPETEYELLYGEPFPEAANLPQYIVDRESVPANPANETFLSKPVEESTPELDDDSYTPEVTLRPRFPEPRTYSPHNITLGIEVFRTNALPSANDPTVELPGQNNYTTYQGYTARYAYSFRTHYWLKARVPAVMSIEAALGIYNFDHTFSAAASGPTAHTAHIRVFTPGFNLRYMVEVSPLFRIYPYVGYSYNIPGATDGVPADLNQIRGGKIIGGGGAQLVVSEAIDARLQGGSDGFMGGLVVKF